MFTILNYFFQKRFLRLCSNRKFLGNTQKTSWLIHYKIRKEAKEDITKCIELFYNQSRIQKGLNFKTPDQMAEDFYKLAV